MSALSGRGCILLWTSTRRTSLTVSVVSVVVVAFPASFTSRSSAHMQLDDPLLAIAIRDGSSSSQDMLVAAESGIVRLMDGDRMITKQEWQAHDNAIFDLKWRPGHDQCLTSSGDTSFSLWDMDRVRSGSMPHDGNAPILTQKSAHMSSIKSISFMDENVLASASRDGCIHVWDIRCNQRAGTIADAHLLPHMRSSSSSGRKKNSSSNPITGRSNPVAAVTAVLFHPHTNKLFSAGASDASISSCGTCGC